MIIFMNGGNLPLCKLCIKIRVLRMGQDWLIKFSCWMKSQQYCIYQSQNYFHTYCRNCFQNVKLFPLILSCAKGQGLSHSCFTFKQILWLFMINSGCRKNLKRGLVVIKLFLMKTPHLCRFLLVFFHLWARGNENSFCFLMINFSFRSEQKTVAVIGNC